MTKTAKMTLEEAVKILNENIPQPNNAMVDYYHLSITIAWEVIKKYLGERKHGEWIKVNNPNYSPLDGSSEYKYFCPECKQEFEKSSNFCPNCGADMRGVADNT